MTTWSEAINTAMARAENGRTAAGNPKLTNLEATGLILFTRDAASWAASQGRPVAWDTYAFALPALGWTKPGDRFVMEPGHQRAIYPSSNELWRALHEIATQLDAAAVPFKLVRDPMGSVATYKELASAAWETMQREHPGDVAPKKPAATTPKPSGAIPDRFLDENATTWNIVKAGAAWRAEVDQNVPHNYAPSLAAGSKKEAYERAKAYAKKWKSENFDAGYVTGTPKPKPKPTPFEIDPTDARAPDDPYAKTKPESGSGAGGILLLGLLLLLD